MKNIPQGRVNFKKGLDLFSYVGSWGMHQLRSGVAKVDFVDQGDFSGAIKLNLENNGFSTERGEFFREDVFRFLDRLPKDDFYDVVVADPPAFTKSGKGKDKALAGYAKLYEKIFKIINKEAILAACSCTNYVTLEELDSIIQQAFRKNYNVERGNVARNNVRRLSKLQLLEIGIEGPDHPVASLGDRTHYLKYLAYFVL
ncbi:MAG: class I SAM-dependent methyltransferase [Oligoflexia bacterium]|nr:class I SAM-dependent methyltransferase [Oligoflexia bacterium]